MIQTEDITLDEIADLPILMSQSFLEDFIWFTKPDYSCQWYHKLVCGKLDDLLSGKIKKLMIFMPPQRGKSEMVSRRFPAFALGKHPDLKIASCCYSADLAMRFNREVQRIIEDAKYAALFPDTCLSSGGGFTKTSEFFEVHGHQGSYKSVGVMGPLTGNPVDLGIIDDPIKDRMEASSQIYRARLWEWYTDVFKTRLHNDSRILLTMTRWHEDDLAGRILASESGWEVLSLPEIKEDDHDPRDPRKIGENLWPERHSLEEVMEIRKNSERTFASMYQQRPAPAEGTIFKEHWVRWFTPAQLPALDSVVISVDASFVDNADACPTSIQAWGRAQKKDFYLLYDETKTLGAKSTAARVHAIWKMYPGAQIVIENAANGFYVIEELKTLIPGVFAFKPNKYGGKEVRAESISYLWEAGNVFLPDTDYTKQVYLPEILTFPLGKYMDRVDAMSQALIWFSRGLDNNAAKPMTGSVGY
jgi:predicted phage terminase large subunit-like protein